MVGAIKAGVLKGDFIFSNDSNDSWSVKWKVFKKSCQKLKGIFWPRKIRAGEKVLSQKKVKNGAFLDQMTHDL